ncbi:acyltransferase family protein [Rhodococcus marinonascens]|uniref:acyltransferase family protein n=1 Tax=Rhodococcus marinonascens TaxID=38311 RepID=UPI000934A29F|nr:acyltransferase [Rhodococcus marinonascens]
MDADSVEKSARRSTISSLTGVRAFAMLLVVGAHAGFWTGKYTPDLVGAVYSRLEIGVAIFFVLSGYLLFRPWVKALAEGREGPAVGMYLRHRARRILPAYWIVVIATYTIYLFRDSGDTGLGMDGFLRNMTFTQIYGFGHLHDGLTQTWTLAVEVVFYMLLPLIAWGLVVAVCGRRWRPGRLVAALCVLALTTPLWIVFTHADTQISITARLWFPGFFAWFVGGMVLAVAATTLRRFNPYAAGGGALVCFLLAITPAAGEATIVPEDGGAAITKAFLYLAFAMFLLAPLVIGSQNGPMGSLCSWAPMVWLGEISYEFFLVHLVVMEFVMEMLGYGIFQGSAVGVFIVTTVLSIPPAWALHRGLARIVLRRRAQTSSDRPSPTAVAAAESRSYAARVSGASRS